MILLLGGTTESALCAGVLKELGLRFCISTATTYSENLYSPDMKLVSGRMDYQNMVDFIRDEKVTMVLDATHPFAGNVTDNGIIAAEICNISFLRYERESWIPEDMTGIDYCRDYRTAAEIAGKRSGNVLFTTGSNHVEIFTEYINKRRLFVRVLNVEESINKCLSAGLEENHIIPFRGRALVEQNLEIIRDRNIELLITKESGITGGLKEKVLSAQIAGISCLIISKPEFSGIRTLNSEEELKRYFIK